MNSTLLVQIHIVAAQLFVLIYLVKTVLLFANKDALLKFSKSTRLLEMIVSTVFLVTGVWLFVILGAIKTLQIAKLILVLISVPLAVVGFKKMNKALALISFLFIVGAYGLAEVAKNKPFLPNNVVVTGNTDAATQLGMKTFAANCAMCHGLDGKKMYRDSKDLSASIINIASVQLLIKEGSKGKMPAFANVLSEEEISAVSTYITSLRIP